MPYKNQADRRSNWKRNSSKNRQVDAAKYAANPDRWYFNSIRKRFGLLIDGYMELYKKGCWLCGQPFEGMKPRPQVEHDHETNTVRGLAHGRCNAMIAMSDDNPDMLRRVADSLEKYLCQRDRIR